MSARTLVFVSCRLLTLYVVISAIQSTGFFAVPALLPQPMEFSALDKLIFLIVFNTGNFAMMIILWFGADWISTIIVDEPHNEKSAFSWSRHDIITTALIIIGIWLIISGVSDVSAKILSMFMLGERAISLIAPGITSIIVGVGLIFGSTRLTNLIQRLRS